MKFLPLTMDAVFLICDNAMRFNAPYTVYYKEGNGGIDYKESLKRFIKDLGPTAQKVANQKLKCLTWTPSHRVQGDNVDPYGDVATYKGENVVKGDGTNPFCGAYGKNTTLSSNVNSLEQDDQDAELELALAQSMQPHKPHNTIVFGQEALSQRGLQIMPVHTCRHNPASGIC
ncbi:hypothetical protein LOK49_LG05G01566 [Camellia lanceoleosa]|uniref:Uncharacterized protein n=1 Tax=Camellia lanceoleosa TaxID=1840588 RepID=A0ACC0HRQ6_9ERIC|nr:hypothetical protein LOK49_LG05G01566 [Camellia lanceoleosa]